MTLREAFATRDNLLDALRLGFAMLVLLAHCWPLTLGQATNHATSELEPVLGLTRHQIFGGTLAVLFFFMLSGFLVTESRSRCATLVEYLTRRVRRIYPGYLVAALVTMFVFAWPFATRPGLWLAEFPWAAAALRTATLHMCATPETFASNPYPLQVNGSLWTIRHEFWCYLLVAGLAALGALRSRIVLWGLFLAAYAIWNARTLLGVEVLPDVHVPGIGALRAWPDLVTFFCAGMLAHRHAGRIVLSCRTFAFCCVLLIATARTAGLSVVLPFAGTYAVFWLAFAPVPWLQLAVARADLSYGVYLYAWPVQQALVAAFPGRFVGHPWVLAAAAVPVTLLLALASWHGVEVPFVRRKRRGVAS